jgi:chemotaxis protein CheX
MVTADDMSEIAKSIWSSVLGLSLQEGVGTGPDVETSISGNVEISGAWLGLVSVEMPNDAARSVAALLFAMEPNEVSEAEMNDALGELANMLGGNVKALLPAPSKLSLPAVSQGAVTRTRGTAEARLVSEAILDAEGVPVRVSLYMYEPAASAA